MTNRHDSSAKEIRSEVRSGIISGPTTGMAKGYTQANVVILKQEYAFDFLLFCQRNPKACPILEVTDPGEFLVKRIAQNADIRTDVPSYRIYENGVFAKETTDITRYWEDDMVAFLLGCSFTFETALMENNIPIRHIEESTNVPMYQTNIPCDHTKAFSGPLVVSMRPMTAQNAIRATQITSRFPDVHGSPVHIGAPEEIGISDIYSPDFGDPPVIKDGEIPVFWACGVTPQAVAMNSKPALMITHAPGCMFVSDIKDQTLSVL